MTESDRIHRLHDELDHITNALLNEQLDHPKGTVGHLRELTPDARHRAIKLLKTVASRAEALELRDKLEAK